MIIRFEMQLKQLLNDGGKRYPLYGLTAETNGEVTSYIQAVKLKEHTIIQVEGQDKTEGVKGDYMMYNPDIRQYFIREHDFFHEIFINPLNDPKAISMDDKSEMT